MVEGRDCLRKNLPYEVFADRVLGLSASSDQLLQVSTIAIFHYYVDFGTLFVNYSVKVLDDVGVAELAKDVDLRHYLLLFFLAHNAIVQLLPDQCLLITYSAHFLNLSKRSYTKKD